MTKVISLPSIERLKQLFSYDAETGIFIRLVNTANNRMKAGTIAGTCRNDGYLEIMVDGRLYLSHRLAWKYFYGEDPAHFLDHINHKRDDNRISNLRVADDCQNMWNRRTNKNSKSRIKGVQYVTRDGRWCAVIKVKWKKIKLGRFDTKEEAAKARLEMLKKYHGEYAYADYRILPSGRIRKLLTIS